VLAGDEPGRAEAIVAAHVPAGKLRRAVFTMDKAPGPTARREAAWDAAAAEVLRAFDGGAATVAFATIGDPNVYSTFTYLATTVRAERPDVVVQTVPGITAMQDLAARAGTVLCEGTETLALFPLTAGLDRFGAALSAFDTVVAYKGGRHLPAVLDVLRAAGRLDDAVYGASLGLPGEQVLPAAQVSGPGPYLSTLLVPARRDRRGGKL
jgi:precorrin-2/cobalt-factor-2 C20-methyltransferase